MTKRAVILHGTDGIPGELRWEVWLKKQLEDSGYEVFYPQLPDAHAPNLATYDAFLWESGWDFTDNVVIGHSSGATTLLHLLGQNWFPKLKAAVLVGTFLNESKIKSEPWYEPGQFDSLLIEEFDPAVIREGAEKLYVVHGDDDPFCDYDLAQELCEQVGGTFVSVPGGGHIGVDADIGELPELAVALRKDGLMEEVV